jgi:hypothetical protein
MMTIGETLERREGGCFKALSSLWIGRPQLLQKECLDEVARSSVAVTGSNFWGVMKPWRLESGRRLTSAQNMNSSMAMCSGKSAIVAG